MRKTGKVLNSLMLRDNSFHGRQTQVKKEFLKVSVRLKGLQVLNNQYFSRLVTRTEHPNTFSKISKSCIFLRLLKEKTLTWITLHYCKGYRFNLLRRYIQCTPHCVEFVLSWQCFFWCRVTILHRHKEKAPTRQILLSFFSPLVKQVSLLHSCCFS